jgi:hypothetical protein
MVMKETNSQFEMKNQKKQNPHIFILERDPQYSKGFPDTLPFHDDFLPENTFFKPAEAVVDWDFYTSKGWARSSQDHLSIENNQLMLKKWLSNRAFDYEHDDERHKIRGKKFDEIQKIKLKIEKVICERVKEKRLK